MIIKLLFLFAALKLQDVVSKAMSPAILYSLGCVLVMLLSSMSFLSVIAIGIVTFCVALVYFTLLSKYPSGSNYYAIMIAGGLFLLIVL